MIDDFKEIAEIDIIKTDDIMNKIYIAVNDTKISIVGHTIKKYNHTIITSGMQFILTAGECKKLKKHLKTCIKHLKDKRRIKK